MRTLVITWLQLVALTALAGVSSDLIGTRSIGPLPVVIIAVATLLKARLILLRYLKLDRSKGLLPAFTAASAAIIVVVAASMVATSAGN